MSFLMRLHIIKRHDPTLANEIAVAWVASMRAMRGPLFTPRAWLRGRGGSLPAGGC